MFPILTLSATVLCPVLFLPPVYQPTTHAAVRAVDTGSSVAASPRVLTPPQLQSYAAVNQALAAYWAAHPDRKDTAETYTKGFDSFTQNGGVTLSAPRIDYARLAQQDSAVASIFAHAQLTPVQFATTRSTVLRIIWALLHDESADSTTVTGRNMALVRAQRPALARDWTELQAKQNRGTQIFNMLMSHASNRGDQAPLAP